MILASLFTIYTLAYTIVNGRQIPDFPWTTQTGSIQVQGIGNADFEQGIRQTLVELRQGLEQQFMAGCNYMILFPVDSGRNIGIINAACLTSPLQGGGVTLTGMSLSGVVIPTDDATASGETMTSSGQ